MRATATRSTRRAALVSILPLAVIAGVMTGCTAAATPADGHAASAPPKAVTAHDGTVTQVTHAPGTTQGYVGALKDVALTSCGADKVPARFGGTVTNPTSTVQSYRIYVSLLAAGGTFGVREVDVQDVAGHATQNWSGTLPVGETGASCVLRVERQS